MTQTCPNPDVLRGLLDTSLPEPVQEEVVAHLDGCTSCQVKLEQIAAGGSSILQVARAVKHSEVPAATSAYWPAVQRVEQAIETPVHDLVATRTEAPLTKELTFDFLDPPEDPTHLGQLDRFQIVELVGRGGMGLVFRGFDACLQRTVAVKLLDPQYAKNDLARSRFIREARAAAGVAHENVVTIHHVDCLEDKGLSFMVMQYVRGRSLQERLDQGGQLSVREAVRIAAATAAGLAAAHEIGLTHRDIKPGNVLIEQSSGRVLLTDFGLARLTEDVKLTQTGFVAGTPLYMSPEQARGDEVDHRSDLFSLGSVLYAMLTGVPPFTGTSAFTVLKKVTDGRPRPVQELNSAVPNSLADVVERLMEKVPKDRFATAADAAVALNAELLKLPPETPATIVTRRSSRAVPQHVRSWWRRHGLTAAAAVASIFAIFLVAEATKVTHLTVLGQRGQPLPERVVIDSDSTVADVEDPPAKYVLPSGEGAVWSVAFAPSGTLMATATEGGMVKFWDTQDGHILGSIDNRKSRSPVWSIAFNNDSTQLFTASDDGFVRQWDVKTREEILPAFQHSYAARTMAISPNGKILVSGTRNGEIVIWDVETRKEKFRKSGHEGAVVTSLTFAPNGDYVASAGSDKTVRIWNVKDGTQKAVLEKHGGPVYAVAFDPTSKILASAGWDRSIRLWDVETSKDLKTFPTREDIWSLAFCPVGKHLFVGGQDRTARWMDVDNGSTLKTYRGLGGPVHAVAISKTGLVAAGGRDGTVRVWSVNP
ncbi:MAG TPA: serine/threonine-protein kinase [Gemmataceae bacterium]|jgi:WD40 repeat protein/predicted Ser/Thr protein kinase|nr:serine/threonine-protein kinase [Gemmataceae bacterium]